MSLLETFAADVRHAVRGFRRSPGFAVAVVAALSLGIGVNTAIFSVVNAVLLKPLAFPDASRVVFFMSTTPRGASSASSPAKFAHYLQLNDVTEKASAFSLGVVNFTGGEIPEQLRSARVSAEFFDLFGARLHQGRFFSPEEDRPGGPRVAILSRGLWENRFDADPEVIGDSVSLGGAPHTVVGVLDALHFEDFGRLPQVFVPFQLDPGSTDQGHYFQVAGRLRDGVGLETARARARASGASFSERFPDALPDGGGFDIEPIGEVLVRNVRQSLLVLAGAVAFVLLIACANVAGLMLVRATARRREVAIRAALGGARSRLVRQLLTESVVLALAGGALGLLLGTLGIRALLAVNTAGLPRVGDAGASVALDWRVVLFTIVVSVATGLLFGLGPALRTSHSDLTTTLKEGAGRSGTGTGQDRTRSALVVAEVALALALLIGSALLIRTSIALGHVDPGFDASNVLTLRTSLAGPAFETSAGVERVILDAVDRLEALPGVEVATATCCVPLQGGYGLPYRIVGRPTEDGPFHGSGQWMTTSPGYFDVFRIPVRRGRVLDRRDDAAAPAVVEINEAMVRAHWPDSDPLGDRLVIGRGVMREFDGEPDRLIIGVVGDTRDGGLNSDPQPAMYIPQAQVPDPVTALNAGIGPMAWVVRTRRDPSSMSRPVQEALRRATDLPVSDVRTMSDIVSLSTSRQRFNMWSMSVFGASALLLAALGIYGLMAFSVAQRRRELGIRVALGAEPAAVGRMVVVQGMRLAGLGIALGLVGAFGLSRLVESFLFGVAPSDPAVFAAVPLLLGIVALLAVALPARRAGRTDPMVALRYE